MEHPNMVVVKLPNRLVAKWIDDYLQANGIDLSREYTSYTLFENDDAIGCYVQEKKGTENVEH